jgi:hypothetical protein
MFLPAVLAMSYLLPPWSMDMVSTAGSKEFGSHLTGGCESLAAKAEDLFQI